MKKIEKKSILIRALLAAALILILGSCSGKSDETKSEAANETVVTESAEGGTLVVGHTTTVTTLVPHPYGAGTYPFRDALYDPFITVGDDGSPIPALAESWTLSDDGLVFTMKLRQGVTYHDGTPFDADAALANIEWFKQPSTRVQGAGSWKKISVKALDSQTVELTFPQPMPEIYSIMSVALLAKPDAWDQGIGTGPFVLEEFTPRVEMKLKKNENYWDSRYPKVDALELREFSDSSAAGLVMASGDLDILLNIKPLQAQDMLNAGLLIQETPGPGNHDILVNSTDAGITDPLIRRALSLAFDRQRYVDIIMKGYATPVSSIYAPASPVHQGAQDVTPFDLEAARALLDEAGVDTLEISIMSPTVLPMNNFMPIYLEDLAKIGVTLSIEPSDPATWAQAVAKSGSIPHTSTHAYGFSDLDPAMIFSAHPFRVGSNASGFLSDEYASLVTKALASTDLDDRYAAFRAVDEYVKDQAFMFPVANAMILDVVSQDTKGFRRSHQTFLYKEATVK